MYFQTLNSTKLNIVDEKPAWYSGNTEEATAVGDNDKHSIQGEADLPILVDWIESN